MTMLVMTGSACAPIAAIVATSPADPPAPLGSLTLKLITHAGAACSSRSPGSASAGGETSVMGCSKGAGESRSRGFRRPLGEREQCCVCPYTALLFREGPCLQSGCIVVKAPAPDVSDPKTWMCLICGWIY